VDRLPAPCCQMRRDGVVVDTKGGKLAPTGNLFLTASKLADGPMTCCAAGER